MNSEEKGILANAIIIVLNDEVDRKNEDLCRQNLFSFQIPRHGMDMFLKLVFMDDNNLIEVAKACGV